MEWFGHAASGGHPQSAYNLAVASVNGDHAELQVTQKPDQRLITGPSVILTLVANPSHHTTWLWLVLMETMWDYR